MKSSANSHLVDKPIFLIIAKNLQIFAIVQLFANVYFIRLTKPVPNLTGLVRIIQQIALSILIEW